jgi:hypothetical protein
MTKVSSGATKIQAAGWRLMASSGSDAVHLPCSARSSGRAQASQMAA